MDPLDFSQFEMSDDGSAEGAVSAPAADPAPVVVANGSAGARVLTLLAPPTVDRKRLRRIVLRPVTQGDIDDLADGTLSGIRALLCRITGQHPATIKGLQWVDARALHEMFIDGLPDFLRE